MLLFAGMELCMNLSLKAIYNSTLTGCYSHLQKKVEYGAAEHFSPESPLSDEMAKITGDDTTTAWKSIWKVKLGRTASVFPEL